MKQELTEKSSFLSQTVVSEGFSHSCVPTLHSEKVPQSSTHVLEKTTEETSPTVFSRLQTSPISITQIYQVKRFTAREKP